MVKSNCSTACIRIPIILICRKRTLALLIYVACRTMGHAQGRTLPVRWPSPDANPVLGLPCRSARRLARACQRLPTKMCPTPKVCAASGGNDKSTRRRASSLAITASVELEVCILIKRVNAVTLSLLTLGTLRSCFQIWVQRTTATSMARASQTCCPHASPRGSPNLSLSS